MDPDACFSMMLEHVADGEFDDAAELAASLQHWLRRGGFQPGGCRIRESSLNAFLSWLVASGRRHADDLSEEGE